MRAGGTEWYIVEHETSIAASTAVARPLASMDPRTIHMARRPFLPLIPACGSGARGGKLAVIPTL